MPVLLLPLAIVGAALLSVLLLYMYEQAFGSPLEGLAKSVPVIGGYLASGVQAAVDYGKAQLYKWTADAFDTVAGWLDALTDRLTNFPAAVDAAIHEIVDGLDHLTHVTVHEIVKAFVNPVRDLAQSAAADASSALAQIAGLEHDVARALNDVEGELHTAVHDVLDTVENVDLPNLAQMLQGDIAAAAGTVAGDVDALHDWAAGWIEQLQHEFSSIPLSELLAGLASVTALAALVNTIARESGLEGEACRRKVKGVCGTDPRGWEQLLGAVTPLFALASLAELVQVASAVMGQTLPAVEALQP